MQSWHVLPRVSLHSAGDVSRRFVGQGVQTYRDAGRYVHHLPYGRNTDRANYRLVLSEGRGTCSTKYALLAQLAQEQGLALALTLGIYHMTEANTPGVGPVLDRYGLDSLPEAHCYLSYAQQRIDVTRAGVKSAQSLQNFVGEEIIAPEQIGGFKVSYHRRFLRAWIATDASGRRFSFEDIWKIRERCIAALAQ